MGVGGGLSQILMLQEARSWVNQGENSNMAEGGIKNSHKNSDYFYGRPLNSTKQLDT